MVSLRRDDNGNFSARKRLPNDVREEYGRRYGQRFEAKFFVAADRGQAEAKRLFAEWEAEVANRVAAIRAAQRGEGIDLSRKDALGLAGEWYNWFISRHEDDPGKPERWDSEWWLLIDALLDYAPAEVRERPITNLEWTREPEIRAGVRPVLADRGHTAQFLADRGIALTNVAQTLFLDSVLDNYSAALLLLERRAKGDYEPDELPNSFPAFASDGTKSDGLTPWQLFEAWVKSKRPKQSTIESWRTVFNALMRDFPDRGASTIKPDEAQRWLDGLVTTERSPFTVRNTWLRATKTVFAWGARRKLTTNPFAETVVDVPRKKQLRPKWFYEQERKTILAAAAAIERVNSPDEAARRWVPWLLAYTGARPQEITQLRGKDVQEVDGVWAINITPEAGTVKNAKARRAPLHAHLIEQGFLEFAKTHGNDPLFYRARRSQPSNPDPIREAKSPAAQVRQRLAAWVREIGVDDEDLSPLHAWRHTFKHIGSRDDIISERLLDYICGHAPATVGRAYGEPTLKDLAAALTKFPKYET
jgi:integrase